MPLKIGEKHGIHCMSCSSNFKWHAAIDLFTIATMDLQTDAISILAEVYVGDFDINRYDQYRNSCYGNLSVTSMV